MIDQRALFDEHPIKLAGGIVLHSTGATIERPRIDDWGAALEFAWASQKSSPYWLGALWEHAENRPEWKGKLPQLLGELGLDVEQQTLYNHALIYRKVCPEAKAISPGFAHSRAVADLEPEKQVALLQEAKTEGWTSRELEAIKKSRKRRAVVEGRAILKGKYRVIYADPPWSFRDSQVSTSNAGRHYDTMEIADICKLPVEAHAEKDSVLFLWVPVPMLFDDPGPKDVITAWGFEYRQQIVWDKVLHNHSHYVSARHELLLICTRGSCVPDDPQAKPDSVQTIRREGEHSEKPEEFRRLIEMLYDKGPYLELFGRRKVEGWDVFGNDSRLWASQVA